MKLFIILFLAATTITSLAVQSRAESKKSKLKRATASVSNTDTEIFNSTISALSKSSLLKNSTALANQFAKSKSFECSELVENTELKNIEPVADKGYRFNGIRLCFDQSGPGVVEIQYEGLIKNSEIKEFTFKLVQDSKG